MRDDGDHLATPGDKCCPAGMDASEDSDCPAKCGDGIVDSDETCEVGNVEKPCPTTCDDKDACTKDMLAGSATQCTAACVNTAITKASGGDMCCPTGANALTGSQDLVCLGCDKHAECPTGTMCRFNSGGSFGICR